jgi:hypothetical protein
VSKAVLVLDPSQGLSGTRHQPDPSFTRAFLGAFVDRAAEGVDEQVCWPGLFCVDLD